MHPEMSEAVRRALDAARAHAIQAGAAEVRPRDLLRGLLAEEEGRAWGLLTGAGLNAAHLRAGNATTSQDISPGQPIPLGPDVTQVVEEARRLSRTFSAEHLLSSECLLLALLQYD